MSWRYFIRPTTLIFLLLKKLGRSEKPTNLRRTPILRLNETRPSLVFVTTTQQVKGNFQPPQIISEFEREKCAMDLVVFSHCSMSIGRMESMVITSPELPMFFGVFRRHSSLQLLSPSQFLVTWVCEGHQRHNPFFFSLRKGYNPWRLCKRLKIWWRQSCCFVAERHTKLTFENGRRQRSQMYLKVPKWLFTTPGQNPRKNTAEN